MADWSYFDKFDGILNKYMPVYGEGETMASQIVTAVNKLIYKWYNDGDVYDNTGALEGWCNDLSSYANWLVKYVGGDCAEILMRIFDVYTGDEYELILKELADFMFDECALEYYAKKEKVGSIYHNCGKPFRFVENKGDEDYD